MATTLKLTRTKSGSSICLSSITGKAKISMQNYGNESKRTLVPFHPDFTGIIIESKRRRKKRFLLEKSMNSHDSNVRKHFCWSKGNLKTKNHEICIYSIFPIMV